MGCSLSRGAVLQYYEDGDLERVAGLIEQNPACIYHTDEWGHNLGMKICCRGQSRDVVILEKICQILETEDKIEEFLDNKHFGKRHGYEMTLLDVAFMGTHSKEIIEFLIDHHPEGLDLLTRRNENGRSTWDTVTVGNSRSVLPYLYKYRKHLRLRFMHKCYRYSGSREKLFERLVKNQKIVFLFAQFFPATCADYFLVLPDLLEYVTTLPLKEQIKFCRPEGDIDTLLPFYGRNPEVLRQDLIEEINALTAKFLQIMDGHHEDLRKKGKRYKIWETTNLEEVHA